MVNGEVRASPSPDAVRRALARARRAVTAVSERMERRDEAGNRLSRPGPPAGGPPPIAAAVLVPLYLHGPELRVALIRRPERLSQHPGQIALPGGRVDDSDASHLAAALRESEEELGLDPEALEVWSELEPIYIPPTHFEVHAFVAYAGERPDFRPNPHEVAELLEVPLSALLPEEALRYRLRDYEGRRVREAYFDWRGAVIWGATAVILEQMLERIRVGLRGGADDD